MTKGRLRQEFGKRAARPEHLERLLQKLEALDIEAIPLKERSKVIQHLTRTIFNEAAQGAFWHRDPETKAEVLIEEPFAREVSQILRMLKSFALSDYAMQWAVSRGIELGYELEKQFPPGETELLWQTMALDEKKALLEDITALQCKVFQKGAISFVPAKVKFRGDVAGVAGFVESLPIHIETKTITHINIHKARAEDGQFAQCAATAVHEQLHGMFIQLAIAERHGFMPEDHPMKADAVKLLARHSYFGFGCYPIKSAYAIDPEEKLTFACQNAFSTTYTTPAAATEPEQPSSGWGRLRGFARRFGF